MYYCKNCGEMYSTDEAVMCVKCGVPRNSGNNYCHNCGNIMKPEDTICFNCGVPTEVITYINSVGPIQKSRVLAGVLGLFLGSFGAHNFYLGYTGKAVTQLVISIIGILLCCIVIGIIPVMAVWIWSLVESIMLFAGKIDRDANGMSLID